MKNKQVSASYRLCEPLVLSSLEAGNERGR